MIRARLGLAVSSSLLLLATAGCSSDDSGSDDAGGSGKPEADKALEFSVVEAATADLASDECAQPVWGENETGAEGQTDFRQLDCYAEGDDPDSALGALPELVQTVVWVQFASADEAQAYADAELSDRTVLVAGPTVLSVAPYAWADQAADLVAEVQEACGCGTLAD